MKTVYLCGPINSCTDSEMHDWRDQFTQLWNGPVKDPTDRDYRFTYITEEIAKDIVEDDLYDIDESQALVMYYPYPSNGSSMEVFYAHRFRKIPVVIINASGSTNLSPWLIHHCDRVVDTVEEAVNYLKAALS